MFSLKLFFCHLMPSGGSLTTFLSDWIKGSSLPFPAPPSCLLYRPQTDNATAEFTPFLTFLRVGTMLLQSSELKFHFCRTNTSHHPPPNLGPISVRVSENLNLAMVFC